MLELLNLNQTLHNNSYDSWVRFRERSHSIIVTECPYVHLKQVALIYNGPIYLIFKIYIPITTRYTVLSETYL